MLMRVLSTSLGLILVLALILWSGIIPELYDQAIFWGGFTSVGGIIFGLFLGLRTVKQVLIQFNDESELSQSPAESLYFPAILMVALAMALLVTYFVTVTEIANWSGIIETHSNGLWLFASFAMVTWFMLLNLDVKGVPGSE